MLEDISLSGVATMHGPISVVYQQTPTVVTLSGMDHASGPGGITDLWLLAGRLVTGAFAFYRRRGSAI
ncbi:MAG: hypothetical protein HZY76_20480 [Anaerolineae bacterium]|nr:MAG: hypothetical protein HZY76_20480 [Anaerolineae bacterium]